MNYLRLVKKGILDENPAFALLLGMCPTLATTTSALNGIGMGLATTFVLICSNMVISAVKKLIPDQIRIPAHIVIIASFVTVLQMYMQAYLPELHHSLGLFIPLIAVNCIVFAGAESFASKNKILASGFDGLGAGLGFTLALMSLGLCREFLGTGQIWGLSIFPDDYGAIIFVLAPGAFIALGYIIAIVNKITKK